MARGAGARSERPKEPAVGAHFTGECGHRIVETQHDRAEYAHLIAQTPDKQVEMLSLFDEGGNVGLGHTGKSPREPGFSRRAARPQRGRHADNGFNAPQRFREDTQQSVPTIRR